MRILYGVGAIIGLVALALAGAVLGGSVIWTLDGAHNLDISGVAPKAGNRPVAPHTGWARYGGDDGGARFSDAAQITLENVSQLSRAWTYSTGDMKARPEALRNSAFEATPILVDDALVFCTPFNEVIALDPGTGAQKWRFDPKIDLGQRPANQFVCRGVAYWREAGDAPCASRVFEGTNDGRLIALDARTGARCENFGDHGEVKIDPGMPLRWPGEFQITSAPTLAGDIVVVGSSISDNGRVEAPYGTVRAFDARTGAPAWTFDPVPRTDDAPGRASWRVDGPITAGQANVWSTMSYDAERDLLFLPTTSASPDFFGGLRPGDDALSDSVVAVRAATGKVVWSFQTVHHDVWDYDLPAQPGLYTVWKDGKAHDVVAQVTKTGLVFVLDRDTGAPFLPVEERAVPQDGAPGEALSPTQPFPVAPPPIVPDRVSPKDAFGLTWFDKTACAAKLKSLRTDGLFTPPGLHGTLLYPFTGGGANWGGAAYDESRNLLVINMSNLAHAVTLIPTTHVKAAKKREPDVEISPQAGAPFGMKREVVVSSLDLPCTPPPWGVIAGVDLSTGKIVWRKTLGTTEDLGPGSVALGTPNFGGPVATAGGLVFIGAAMDDYLRAFDTKTGAELWKGRLPAGGQATPMTYEWGGRQYVVIAAGGHARVGTKLGDEVVAFALP